MTNWNYLNYITFDESIVKYWESLFSKIIRRMTTLQSEYAY